MVGKIWNHRQPFQGSGTELDPTYTIEQQIEQAGLGWGVERSSFTYGNNSFKKEAPPSFGAVYRTDTKELLSIHGKTRKIFQNTDVIEVFHQFCENANDDLNITRMGELDGGKTIFAIAKLNKQFDVLNMGDTFDSYLVLTESHKAGTGLQVRVMVNRLACMNGMVRLVKVRNATVGHTRQLSRAKILEHLEKSYQIVDTFKEETELLAKTAITDQEARMHLIKCLGSTSLEWDEQPRPVKVAYRLFNGEGQGSEKMTAFNTMLGLQQAVTEYQNWGTNSAVPSKVFGSLLSGNRGALQEKFTKQLLSCTAF